MNDQKKAMNMDLNNFNFLCLRLLIVINQAIWGIVLSFSGHKSAMMLISYFVAVIPSLLFVIFENTTWFFRNNTEKYLYGADEPCVDGLNSKSLVVTRGFTIIISLFFIIFWIIYRDDTLLVVPYILLFATILFENTHPCMSDEHNGKISKLLCCKTKEYV